MLSRTRNRIKLGMKGLAYDLLHLDELVESRRIHALEDSMGFRGQWHDHRAFQIAMLKQNGLRPEHNLLELGCGPLTAGIPIINFLGADRYVGVDIRESVLNLAWQEIGKHGLSSKNPRLIFSVRFAEEELKDRKFDFVYSFSVLYHLDDTTLDNYFAAVARRLCADGKCIANVNDTIPSDKWLEFPFLKRTIPEYEAAARRHNLRTENLGTIAGLGFKGQGIEKENPLLVFYGSS